MTTNPFDDDISLLSGDCSGDDGSNGKRRREWQLPQQVPGPSQSSLVSKLAVKTTSPKVTEQPRPTQERGRSHSTMLPGHSLASIVPEVSGDGTTSASTAVAPPPMTQSQSNVRRRMKLSLPHLPNMNPKSDDVSVADSLCSGVLREFANANTNAKALARKTRSKIASKIASIENRIANNGGRSDGVNSASTVTTATMTAADAVAARPHVSANANANAKALARTTTSKIASKIVSIENRISNNGGGGDGIESASTATTATMTTTTATTTRSHVKSSAEPPADQPAGWGEVVDVFPDIGFSRFDTNVSSMRTDSSQEANGDGDGYEDIHDDIMREIVDDDGHNDDVDEDEARLRREERKERGRERLERYKQDHEQLRATCAALESALAKTSEKLLEVNSRAASKIKALESKLFWVRKEEEATLTNQETCIKELGGKLIRQAHVIKRQKDAVEKYKMRLEAMAEELAMQDERDVLREEDMRRLEDLLENSRDRQEQMQTMLQNNIEGMIELKCEVERGSKNIMELEYNLEQKEAMLNRVARDQAEKTQRLCELEQVLEDKTFEVESVAKQLNESKESVEAMRQQLEAATKEIEDIKCKFSGWGTSKVDGEAVGDVASIGRSPRSWRRASIDKSDNLPLIAEEDDSDNDLKEAFASELQAKDATIQTLDDACKEKDATINALRSDMVKTSSTYKQDSYLKRKEIAKLKQQNAEYALRLRVLEKAFQCVNATESMSAVSTNDGTKFLAHSAHGGGGGRGKGWETGTVSLHGKSVSRGDKDGIAAAVSARLGGLRLGLLRDSKVVQEANFFDDDDPSFPGASDKESSSGGKGEDPEEC